MSTLSSSQRMKRRYLLIEGAGKEAVERAVLTGIGTLGWPRAAPLFVTPQRTQPREALILSVERASVQDIRTALELSPTPLKIVRISGTLKGLFK